MLVENYSQHPGKIANVLVRLVKCDSNMFSAGIRQINFEGCLSEFATLYNTMTCQIKIVALKIGGTPGKLKTILK